MLIVDVREPFEYQAEHVEGAVNIPLSQLMNGDISQLSDVKSDEQLVVYCRSGGRAAQAIQMLKSDGFTNVVNGINKSEIEGKWCDT